MPLSLTAKGGAISRRLSAHPPRAFCMKKKNKTPNTNEKTGIAGSASKRYNVTKAPTAASTLEPFQSEDQALAYLAEILAAAYSEQKTV